MFNNNNKSFLAFFALSIAGGMAGAFFVVMYFINFNLPLLNPIDLTENFNRIFVQSPKKLVVEQDLEYNRVINNARGGIIEIYKKSALNNALKKELDLGDNIIYPEQFVGKGVILTSDGWITFYNENFSNTNLEDYIILSDDGKIYTPVESKKDNFSNLVFLKVEATGLPVLNLFSEGTFTKGQTSILIGRNGKIKIENISDNTYSKFEKSENYIKFSDSLNRFIMFNSDISDEYAGAPVFSLHGSILGIMNSSHTAIPAKSINRAFSSILKHNSIIRPLLGIKYIDLSSILGDINYEKKGILVFEVLPTFSAFEAGIKKGDIILKVEHDEVKGNNFAELIQEYETGTLVNFVILREDKQIEKQVLF
ncbi:PDZ domain-containing protein [Patescibacteria group bacterium]